MTQKLRNLLSTPIGHALLSKRNDDAYIAAFPRSGSTWLRTMLVNAMDSTAMSNPDVFNARIPAVSIRNAKNINALESPRIIMTHSVYRRSINKALYLVRDGRDAFISSYHYHVTRNKRQLSIDSYYKQYRNRYYGCTWEEHVESWLRDGRNELGENSMVVKFEELKYDPKVVLKRAVEFFKLDVDDSALDKAVENSSLDKARAIEQQRQGIIEDRNASFYRGGHSQQWQTQEHSVAINKFQQNADRALALAGYLD